MKKIQDKIYWFVFKCWLWFGATILKWQFIDIYAPDKEIVIAVTFSHDEEYVDKISKIEL